MPLEKLILKNFQGHEDFSVALDPLCTTFVGPSDSGKSAILRAIRWLALNQPSGARFVRHGASLASVAAKVDGRWIERRRGNRENSYLLDGDAYSDLRSFPAAIAELLQVEEVNFQGQHDAAFWLSDTSGQVSKYLNEVVNLSEIDSLMATAAEEVKSCKADVATCEARIAEHRTKRDELEWIVTFDEELSQLEGKEKEIADLEEQIADLSRHLDALERMDNRIAALDGVVEAGDRVIDTATRGIQVAANLHSLEEILERIDRADRIIARDPSADFERLQKLRSEGDELAVRISELGLVIDDLEKSEGSIWRLDEKIAELEKELTKEMDGKCPLCGQKADLSQLCQFVQTANVSFSSIRPKYVGDGDTADSRALSRRDVDPNEKPRKKGSGPT
jgi:DNA repair ATPase RecN